MIIAIEISPPPPVQSTCEYSKYATEKEQRIILYIRKL